VLRHWRWQRLRGRTKPAGEAPPRPGDAVAEGAYLYLSGLAAHDEDRVTLGLRQMLAGIERSIGASGATLEGSTLRQAQLARVTTEAWLGARRAGRPEQWRLASAARSIIGAYEALHLSGGLPEFGEKPAAMGPYAPFSRVDDADAPALDALRRLAKLNDLETLRADGWLRLDCGPWSGLWHCPPGGWPVFDGLAHHDLGAAELHWNGMPLLVDPGPSYRAAAAHGGLTIDRKNPYPETHGFYSDAFRREVAGPAPELRTTHDGVRLAMDGFARFGGHRQIERHWRFAGAGLRIEDVILGTGKPLIERRLVTPWLTSLDAGGVILSQSGYQLRLATDGAITLHPAKRWNERGVELPLTVIVIATRANLPWNGALTLLPVSA
jgi:hypothetical protein